ncbi:MAG TPA: prepilin peptidase [Kofleriaceae bacterium]|nr:prepilin peptidase [Kofleriaceae bacterium]
MDLLVPSLMIAVAATAAVTDARTGLIPNWLTLPPLLAALILHFITQGAGGLMLSLAGALVCGLVPYLLFRHGSMGGGDVKLLAALGALGGAEVGLEIEVLGMSIAAVYALAFLAWRGGLARTLLSSMWLVVNVFLPARYRRPIPPAEMMPLRLGVPLLLGTLASVLLAGGAR